MISATKGGQTYLEAGGMACLGILIESAVPAPYLIPHHAAMILKLAHLRRLGLLSERLGSSVHELIADPDQLLLALFSKIK
jgi:hypothetical protein